MSPEFREQGLKVEAGADDAARLARNLTRADVKKVAYFMLAERCRVVYVNFPASFYRTPRD